eukprot:COSAG03_NODE_175_length_11150_cov_7.837691_12_plen_36_part_01
MRQGVQVDYSRVTRALLPGQAGPAPAPRARAGARGA